MNVTELHVSELEEFQKQWYALALCTMIIADGNVAPSEVYYLEKALSFLSSPSQVENLIDGVKEGNLPQLEKLEATTQELRVKMLIELTQASTSDFSLTSREMEKLFFVGGLLDFPKEFVQIVIRWANEGILWMRKVPYLIDIGLKLDRTELRQESSDAADEEPSEESSSD